MKLTIMKGKKSMPKGFEKIQVHDSESKKVFKQYWSQTCFNYKDWHWTLNSLVDWSYIKLEKYTKNKGYIG